MRSYLLDTSVIIDYLRGKPHTVKLVDSLEGSLNSSYICLAELYEGIFRVKETQEAEQVVMTFFKSLSKIYPVDEKIAKEFGRVRANLKVGGNIIEDIDIIIAATALAYNLTLVTDNIKHFSHIKGLEIYQK